MSTKIFLKSLKNPDILQKKMVRLVNWMISQKIVLLGGLGLVALVYGGYYFWTDYREGQFLNLSEELSKIDEVFDKEQEGVDNKRKEIGVKIADLETKINAQKPANAQGKDKATAKVDQNPLPTANIIELTAQKFMLQKEMDSLKADHSESLKGYQSFYKGHMKNVQGAAAAFKVMSILIEKKDFAGAKAIVEEVISQFKENPFYLAQGKMNLMSLHEQLGTYQDGIKIADDLLKTVDKEIAPQVLLGKARLEYFAAQKDQAKATINQLITKHGDSPEAKKAKSLKVLLY